MKQYHFFNFSRQSGKWNGAKDKAQCLVGATVHNPWIDIPIANCLSFLKFALYLAKTPLEQLKASADLDIITTRIESEEIITTTRTKLGTFVEVTVSTSADYSSSMFLIGEFLNSYRG